MDTTAPALAVVEQRTIPMPDWGCDLVVVLTADGRRWYPIGPLVAVLTPGMKVRFQVDKLREHAVLRRLVEQLQVKHQVGGRQPTWCLEKRGVGFWLGTLQIDKVRAELRERLIDFQQDVVDAADQIASGELTITPAPAHIRAQLTTHEAQIASVTRFALSLEQRLGRVESAVFEPEGEE